MLLCFLLTATYSYDDANRLASEVDPSQNINRTFSYDTQGNVTKTVNNGVEETYSYHNGRLTSVTRGDVEEKYTYDLFGNPTHFKSDVRNMQWTRGTFLKQYGYIRYSYDYNGNITRKEKADFVDESYYDGDKLIAKKIGNKVIRFCFDLDGVAGFKVGISDRYSYAKDLQGNVIALYDGASCVGRYKYDAWGNCTVTDEDGNVLEYNDSTKYKPVFLNPYRWKSQYYDNDTKLYYIGNRWYNPASGRFISSASPETLLSNADIVFGLNLFAFATGNAVSIAMSTGSIYPSLDFYYNGEEEPNWWEDFGRNLIMFLVGVAATAIACVLSGPCGAGATAATVCTTLTKIAVGTIVGTVMSVAINGITAGIQSAMTGHGFWEAFAESITAESVFDALVTSFATTALTVAAGNALKHCQCFKEGTLVETEAGMKPIEEIEIGDSVLAYNAETGEQDYKAVTRLFRNETWEWYTVHVSGGEIVCTGGHPFYVADFDKFIPARECEVGDRLLLSDGRCATIEAVERKCLSSPETTYNFEVEDFHTYYVGEDQVLVHNKCNNPKIKEAQSKNSALREAKRDAGVPNGQEGSVTKSRVMENGRSKMTYKYTYEIGNNTVEIFEHTTHIFKDTGTIIQHHFHVAINGVKSAWHYVWI